MDQLLVRWCAYSIVLASSLFSVRLYGAVPSEELFPATTKGYVSVPKLEELKSAWGETQLGQMVNDPAMRPFIEDLERQLRTRLNQAGVRLGVNLDDLVGVEAVELELGLADQGRVPVRLRRARVVGDALQRLDSGRHGVGLDLRVGALEQSGDAVAGAVAAGELVDRRGRAPRVARVELVLALDQLLGRLPGLDVLVMLPPDIAADRREQQDGAAQNVPAPAGDEAVDALAPQLLVDLAQKCIAVFWRDGQVLSPNADEGAASFPLAVFTRSRGGWRFLSGEPAERKMNQLRS